MPTFLDKLDEARQAKKHVFVWDKQGTLTELA